MALAHGHEHGSCMCPCAAYAACTCCNLHCVVVVVGPWSGGIYVVAVCGPSGTGAYRISSNFSSGQDSEKQCKRNFGRLAEAGE